MERIIILTCHTEGCCNEGIAIELVSEATQGMCGGCHTEITDIVVKS